MLTAGENPSDAEEKKGNRGKGVNTGERKEKTALWVNKKELQKTRGKE